MPDITSPSWNSLLLVCKACQKRGSGPKDLQARDVVDEARRAIHGIKPRPRVVQASCLGLCPKAAVAVAFVSAGQAPRIVAVASRKQVRKAIPQLVPLLGEPIDAAP